MAVLCLLQNDDDITVVVAVVVSVVVFWNFHYFCLLTQAPDHVTVVCLDMRMRKNEGWGIVSTWS